jgi:hypothetical protein
MSSLRRGGRGRLKIKSPTPTPVTSTGQAQFYPSETVSQFDKTVIPGEQNDVERDPEFRKLSGNQVTLDPGSHPAPRDLAGMTNCDTASREGGDVLLKS